MGSMVVVCEREARRLSRKQKQLGEALGLRRASEKYGPSKKS
jgi:hypothetical protein